MTAAVLSLDIRSLLQYTVEEALDVVDDSTEAFAAVIVTINHVLKTLSTTESRTCSGK